MPASLYRKKYLHCLRIFMQIFHVEANKVVTEGVIVDYDVTLIGLMFTMKSDAYGTK